MLPLASAFKPTAWANRKVAFDTSRGYSSNRRRALALVHTCCASASADASNIVPTPDTNTGPSNWRVRLISAIYPAALLSDVSKRAQELQAYMDMARLVNVMPSFAMVMFGAWCATGRSVAVFAMGPVWVVSLVSAGIAVASVTVNDYFDYRSGVDVVNAPSKPLPQGVVPPDGALLLATAIYIGVLIVACLLESSSLRFIIAAAAAMTLVYTPLMKKVTGLKNLVVAFVIAASPVTGALATGATSDSVLKVVVPCMFLFMGIVCREILMDINDRKGDSAMGISTIPVTLGPHVAHIIAVACLLVASVLGIVSAVTSSAVAMASAQTGLPLLWFQVSAGGGVCLAVRPLFQQLALVWEHMFDPVVVETAINSTFQPIAVVMIVLAALAT